MSKNILFLLVDQWPEDCFGHKGAPIKTPYMDKLKSEGTLFTNAFTTCPLCSPARGGLFTSKWHTQSGMLDNVGVGYSQQLPLDMSQKTWLDVAVGKGYHVGYYGKWHLGPNGPINRGVQRHAESIETYQKIYEPGVSPYNYQRCMDNYQKEGSQILKSGIAPFYGITDDDIQMTNPYEVAKEAKEFLQEYSDSQMKEPFLLTVSINDPHFPHYLPEDYVGEIEGFEVPIPHSLDSDFINKPWFQNKPWWPSMETDDLTKADWVEVITYAYMHRMLVDRALGSVIDQLEALGLADDTTIIFTSDHGDMCGAHNRFDKGPYYYDEVWRVPLIIKDKDIKPAIQPAFVSLLDVGRTVFNMVESNLDEAFVGRDLLPLTGTDKSDDTWPNLAYGMYDNYNGMSFKVRAIRNEDYKYVYNPQSVDEFYDMKNDPSELTNAIEEVSLKTKRESLKAQLFDWMKGIDDPLLEEAKDLPKAGTILPLGIMGP